MGNRITVNTEKNVLKSIIKTLKDNDKAFINLETNSIPKTTIQGEILHQAYGLYVSDKENEVLIVKFCALLSYLCKNNNKSIKEIVDNINRIDSNNSLTESDIGKYSRLNSKLAEAFKTNKEIFSLFKSLIRSGSYTGATILYYWDWMHKNHVLEDLDIEKAILEVTNGEKFNNILKYTNATMICDKCRQLKHVAYMRVGKSICKDCERLKYDNKASISEEAAVSTKKKKSKEISMQLESKIELFKSSEQTFSTEVEHSRDYLMYEAMYNTIINNLYNIMDLDIQSLSDCEKEVIKNNNKQIINLIKEVEERTWEQ